MEKSNTDSPDLPPEIMQLVGEFNSLWSEFLDAEISCNYGKIVALIDAFVSFARRHPEFKRHIPFYAQYRWHQECPADWNAEAAAKDFAELQRQLCASPAACAARASCTTPEMYRVIDNFIWDIGPRVPSDTRRLPALNEPLTSQEAHMAQ